MFSNGYYFWSYISNLGGCIKLFCFYGGFGDIYEVFECFGFELVDFDIEVMMYD